MAINKVTASTVSLLAESRNQEPGNSGKTLSRDKLTALQAGLRAVGMSNAKIDSLVLNYDQIDVNGDGVSSDEIVTYNRKGVTKEQDTAFSKAQLTAIREQIGKSSPQEDLSGLDQVIADFATVDADRDGAVTLSEIRQYAKQQGAQSNQSGSGGESAGRAALLQAITASEGSAGDADDFTTLLLQGYSSSGSGLLF